MISVRSASLSPNPAFDHLAHAACARVPFDDPCRAKPVLRRLLIGNEPPRYVRDRLSPHLDTVQVGDTEPPLGG